MIIGWGNPRFRAYSLHLFSATLSLLPLLTTCRLGRITNEERMGLVPYVINSWSLLGR